MTDKPTPAVRARIVERLGIPAWLRDAHTRTATGRRRPIPLRALALWGLLLSLQLAATAQAGPPPLPQRELAALMGVSRSTVRRARDDLVEAGALAWTRVGRKGSTYRLLGELPDTAPLLPPLNRADRREQMRDLRLARRAGRKAAAPAIRRSRLRRRAKHH